MKDTIEIQYNLKIKDIILRNIIASMREININRDFVLKGAWLGRRE